MTNDLSDEITQALAGLTVDMRDDASRRIENAALAAFGRRKVHEHMALSAVAGAVIFAQLCWAVSVVAGVLV